MKYILFFWILVLVYSCSSIPKKDKDKYLVPNFKLNKYKNINGQLSLLKCSKYSINKYTINFNKSKDSLTFNSSIDFCHLLKEDLIRDNYIISDINFLIIKDKILKYKSFQYGVFDYNKKMIVRKSGGGLYCFVEDFETFQKTIHYRL